MPVKQAELVRKWGISSGRVSQYRAEGMPLDSIEAAEAWRMERYGKGAAVDAQAVLELERKGLPEPPAAVSDADCERQDVYGLLSRIKTSELRQWQAVSEAMERGSSGDVLSRLRVYEGLVTQRLKAEKGITEIEVQRGHLITMDQAKQVVREAQEPLRVMLRGLPQMLAARCNPGDPDLARHALEEGIARVFRSMNGGNDSGF